MQTITMKHLKSNALLKLIGIIIFFQAQVFCQIPTNGLVAYYPFNGNVNDESGNAVNGTNNGGTFINDRYGNASKAIQFNGNSWIDIGTSIQDSIFIINFWANISALPTSGNTAAFISKIDNNSPNLYKNYEVRLLSDGKLNIIIAGGSFIWNAFTSANGLSINNWKMISIRFNGNSASIFIDGLLDASSSFSRCKISNVKTVFGRRAVPNSAGQDNLFFNGKLDEVRFYNRSLSDSEIQQIYQAERVIPDLYIYYLNIPTEVRQGEDAKVTIKATVTKQ